MAGFDIQNFLIWYVCLLFSLSVHEAAHAFAADRCGDPTGRLLGRMTLNPIPHIDPLGTVILPVLMFLLPVGFLFGWAKPVPFNPLNLRDMRMGRVWIAVAGPASNLALALGAAVFLRIFATLAPETPVFDVVIYFSMVLILLNLVLMLFNLIPVPPLDGHHVLHSFVPPHVEETLDRIGPFLFIGVIFFARRIIEVPLLFMMGLIENFILPG